MSEGRSWFYLTLWRGTPPEFTEEFDVDIMESKSALANVITASSADSSVIKKSSFVSGIEKQLTGTANIITRTEVTWYVG